MRRLLGTRLKHSLLIRLGGMFAAITVLAVISMATSWWVAETIQGSGRVINLAGSLRMQNWYMASLHQGQVHGSNTRAAMEKAIRQFETDLRAPAILAVLPADETAPINREYRQVVSLWHLTIKPRLLFVSADPPDVAAEAPVEGLPAFVERIDHLVKQIELAVEAKILFMRLVLGAAVISTLFLVMFSIYLIHHILVQPLRELLAMTDRIGQGNLATRTDLVGEDEIGRLGQAFNHMAEDLSKLYNNLEARVAEKTAELTIANRSLELLYHSIARLYGGPVAHDTYAILLHDLETVLGVGHGIACLVEAGSDRARVIASTLDPGRNDVDICGLASCADCLAKCTLSLRPLPNGRCLLTLPLKDTEHHYGVLQLEVPPDHELAPWQSQLLDALARHIGIAIGTARRTEQSRRLSLLEERATIARELHDSLAQSLAYMKIQVSRLKPLVEQENAGSEAAAVLTELREGLNSAYRQLRELLTTFRLRIDGEGLASALQETVNEFSARGGMPIGMDVRLAGCSLSPNEEIHILQIVREALSNVLNHAMAARADVRIACNADHSVSAMVSDDGRGIRQTADTHHYGLAIMEERARHLGGSLGLEVLPTGGTRVTLHFTPGKSVQDLMSIHSIQSN